ncbi:MAG: Na+/H+ antiporter NhaC family protein [Alteromonas oceani]
MIRVYIDRLRLFGDHCSPISETTILSATGANCSQYEHFKT